MKKLLIFCSTFCLLLILGNKSMAQCSTQTSHSAGCYAYSGQAYDQIYYIPAGIPVHISTFFVINDPDTYPTGAEADMGSQMWYTTASGVGGHGDATTFTAAENTDGFLYLALGSTPNGSGHIVASW